MNSRLEFFLEPRQGHLYAQVMGEFERERLLALLAMIAQRCRQDEYHRVIVDLHRQTGKMEALDQDEAGRLISEVYSRGCWVAFIVNDEALPQYRYLETVARTRGASFRVFTKVKDAEEWLGDPETWPGNKHI